MFGSREGPIADFCEHANELHVPKIAKAFLIN
jgi:hypothetical protein